MRFRHKLYGRGFNHQTIQYLGASEAACLKEA